MAEGEPPVLVVGLRQAALLSAMVDFAISVEVREVELRHAPALVGLLAKVKRGSTGWLVLREIKLGHVARICLELDVLLDTVLPMLRDNAIDADAGRLLMLYGWSIHHLSRKVDGVNGPYHVVVGLVGALLCRHARHLDHGTRGVDWLCANISNLRERLEALKPLVIIFLLGGDGDGDDGGDGGGGPRGDDESEDDDDV